MKKTVSQLAIATLGGAIALTASHFFFNGNSLTHPLVQAADPNHVRLTNFTGSDNAEGKMTDFTLAAEKSVHAVVHIKTVSQQVNNLSYDPFADFFFGPQRRQSFEAHGSGSGVIISPDGYIVTNNHVVNGASSIEVTLNDKRTYDAELIGTDASTDVALLRIKEKDLPFLAYGNSDQVKVGEWALAVGNPFNLYSTVTAGIISAKGRNNIINNGNTRPIESFIQTDAAVNPGNSGGALVNTNGELVGINTAIASNNGAYQGYSFAVPVNIVKKVVSDLIEFGAVQRAYIGVSIADIDAKLAAEKNIPQLNGVYVNGLTEGGSAMVAGVREGDVITAIQDVKVNSVSELQEQVSRYRPGDKINVTVNRKSGEVTMPMVLKTLDNTTRLVKKSDLAAQKVSVLGAEFQTMDAEQLSNFKADNGVAVLNSGAGKLAAVGIQSGFVITAIDKKRMFSADDVKKAFTGKTGNVLVEGFYPNGMRASYSFGL